MLFKRNILLLLVYYKGYLNRNQTWTGNEKQLHCLQQEEHSNDGLFSSTNPRHKCLMFTRNILFYTVLGAFQSSIIFHGLYQYFLSLKIHYIFKNSEVRDWTLPYHPKKMKNFLLTEPFQEVPGLSVREHTHFRLPERMSKLSRKTLFLQ